MSQLLERVLKIHLHPKTGTPYWLEKERELGFSIQQRVQSLDDLHELEPFRLQALCEQPIEYFIPKGLLHGRKWVTGETGGATGTPKTAVYFEEEFQAAFVEPFVAASGWRTRVKNGHWLWLGPSGPHIIGKAARKIAQITTGCDGFGVDFDPRWYRSLTVGSIARKRYLEHLIRQAAHIIRQQNIRFLFSTPVALAALAEDMSEADKKAIELIYLGGMRVTTEVLAELGNAFSNAGFLSGYGNTLFGVCHESCPHRPDNEKPRYFSPSERLVLCLVNLEPDVSDSERLRRPVFYGEVGQVVVHRLDESCFLANVMERDCGIRIAATDSDAGVDGIQDPQPIVNERFTVESGIY